MPLGAFTPAVRDWFARTFGAPTPPQREGWPAIQEGKHTLIAAPTGSGKTLAAFLWAIDALLRQGASLPDATQVLYVSPLKALGNDIQKNLQGPLAEIAAQDLFLPEIRVMVRSGDTTGRDRAAMLRRLAVRGIRASGSGSHGEWLPDSYQPGQPHGGNRRTRWMVL